MLQRKEIREKQWDYLLPLLGGDGQERQIASYLEGRCLFIWQSQGVAVGNAGIVLRCIK